MCVCVLCLEEVHQEYGKHISNEQINASLNVFPGQESRWFVVSVAVGVLQECGKHISESSAIGNLFCILDQELGNTLSMHSLLMCFPHS